MDDQNNKKYDALDVVFGVACLLVVIVFLTYIVNFWNRPIATDASSWGAFGDYIGGVINPILGFFSFMALLITLDLQRKQLNKTEEQLELNREELIDTRKELARSAQAQEDSKRVMDEQLKTQYMQQFDSNFYQMLDQMNKLQQIFLDRWTLISQILDKDLSLTKAKIEIKKQKNLCRYFGFIFEITKFIDQRLDQINSLTSTELLEYKKFYSTLVRIHQYEGLREVLLIY